MMGLRLELSRAAAFQATISMSSFGYSVCRFSRWRTPSIIKGEVNLSSKRRDRLRPEIHDLASSFWPDV